MKSKKAKNLFLIMALAASSFFSVAAANAQTVFGEYAAQDGWRLLEIGKALKQMPETGSRPEDFVPPHWTIAVRAEGDLNADGVKDYAFILMLDEQDAKYIEPLRKLERTDFWIDRTFIIVVADSRGDRRLHINSINHELFGDSGAFARNGDERDEFTIEIKKDVLSVNVDYGGMLRSLATFRFREENPTGGDLLLIGFDFGNTCVTLTENCNKWTMSENYLTSTRIETIYKIRDDKITGTDKKTQITPVRVEFMNARLNHGNSKGDMRPF